MMKRCFLFGHRDVPEGLFPLLLDAVGEHYDRYGIREFVVGHYGGFDAMAGRAVIRLKQTRPDLYLRMLLPYHPAEQPIHAPEGYDSTLYPQGLETVPRPFAIVQANRLMLESADTTICYAYHPGNAKKLLEYAQKLAAKRGLPIRNLAPTK